MSLRSRLLGSVARFVRDDQGVILIKTIVALGVFFGLGALVLDVGRLYVTHSQLQAYADAVALAAAAELDGENGALDRAVLAALGGGAVGPVVTDGANFVTDGTALAVQRLVFLEALGDDPLPGTTARPAGDVVLCSYQGGAFDCPATPVDEAENRVRFVEVTVEPRTVSYFFAPVLSAVGVADAATQGTTQAQAVAGFTRQVCDATPMMICNPYEVVGGESFTPIAGQQILLKAGGAGAGWAPGDFGLLDTAGNAGEGHCNGSPNSAARIECVMALIRPNSSCVGGRVNISPGQKEAVHAGLNVRFDIWGGNLNSKKNNAAFAPARNVTKGLVPQGNQCAQNQLQPSPTTVALPRDACFDSGSCSGGRFGDVVTDAQLQNYWVTNHGTAMPNAVDLDGDGTVTRYEVYRYETDNNTIPEGVTCAPNGYDSPLRDRRKITVAVINCIEHAGLLGGNASEVPVIAFADMFLTEPATPAPDHDIYAEMLGVAEPGGDDGVLHDFPQLFR